MKQPEGDGVILLYVTSVMLVLSWIVLIARFGVRKWINAIGTDDILMAVGLMLYSVTASLVIVCCFYGAGQYAKYIDAPDKMQGTKLFFIAEFFYASCTVPIKSSICVCLLRIADARRRFVWTLYAIIAMAAIAAVIFIVAIANLCHPITTLWGETTTGSCSPTLNSRVSFFFSAVSIVTDFSLAILPGILLWKIQMKRRVKFSVAVMLGLAAFASCATIIRLRYLTLYNDQAEFMFSTGQIGLWSIIEEGIGIIAGSMPALRPLLTLPIFGRSTIRSSNNQQSAPHERLTPNPAPGFKDEPTDEVNMKTFRTSSSNDSPGLHKMRTKTRGSSDDGDSQRNILKETHWTVTAEHTNPADDWARQRVLGWSSRP
ncbi:hypothetical protein G7054_g9972 [Neopestalotiopsis clavispora]|nr:hypothetical protein E8E14_002631 [Neopestalotiopsis sp. 37M]KAF7529000.1 hypothetical protein G7054_g9972 [Neopestalotiopsis clavispora]